MASLLHARTHARTHADIATLSNINNKPVIKIGVQLPLTGNMADMGITNRKAFSKSIQDINSNPENKLYYELLIEDNRNDMRTANSIVTKFIFADKVNVLVDHLPAIARVTAPLATKNKIPNLHYAHSSDFLDSKYNFKGLPTNDAVADATVRLLDSKSIKNVALIIQNAGSGDELLDALSQRLEHRDIPFSVERFNPGEKDFSILVGKTKNRDAEAVVVFANTPELEILGREFNRQGVDKLIVFPSSAVYMNQNINLFEGRYTVDFLQPSASLRKHLGFNEGDNTYHSAFYYDAGTIITQAFEKVYDGTHIPVGDEIADQLLNQKEYQGCLEVYTLDERGRFLCKVETFIVKNGEFVPLAGD